MIPKNISAQRDFSAGELDVTTKRGDDTPEMRAGARQASNWRILNSRGLKNRPGRRAILLEAGRVEELLMSPGNAFYIAFGNTCLRVYDTAGTKVFDSGNVMPWTTATVRNIVWDIYRTFIYITFAGTVPQILSWDGVSAWSLANYAETVTAGGQKRTPFYRISPSGLMLQPSDLTGSVTLTSFEADGITNHNYFVSGMVGTRILFNGRQVLITAITNAYTATATVEEPLYSGESGISAATNLTTLFQVGDEIEGLSSNAKGVVTGRSSSNVDWVLTSAVFFAVNEVVVGPNGQTSFSGIASKAPVPINIWEEEVMNSYRGWPASVFVDQGRLGFCQFPAVRGGIAWSSIGTLTDLYPGANPDSAIFETVPGKSEVKFLVPGPQSSEFVFCDNAIYYIPISETNPLKPGSVGFQLLTREGSSAVQPRSVRGSIAYVDAGLTGIMTVVATGAYLRPFETAHVSRLHSHLIKSPIAIAAPNATSTFEEQYVYVLNSDSTIAVGKYDIENGQVKGTLGWVPWSGGGASSWVAALGSDVIFTSSYTPNGITPISVVELLDDTKYLDASVFVNAVPSGIPTPGGKGPLWWLANGSVFLIDLGTRFMDTYQVDANGFIIPQNIDGENLASSQLVAGQSWTATWEPFLPAAAPGQDAQQRLKKRRVSRALFYVQNSTGFTFGRRRIEAWNFGEDPAQPAPLREGAYSFRPTGRSYDPRIPLLKDTPGPLTIIEASFEVSV